MQQFLILFLCCYGWLYLSVLVHITTHVAACKLISSYVQKVNVGVGDWYWRFSIRGIPWQLSPIPFGGYVHHRPSTHAGLAWRGTVLTLAVLAADSAMLWALIRTWPHIEEVAGYHHVASESGLLGYMIALRVFDMLIHFLPVKVSIDGLSAPSVGTLFFEYVSGKYPKSWCRTFRFFDIYRISMLRYDPEFQYTSCWLLRASREEQMFLVQGDLEMDKQAYDTALEHYEKLLALPGFTGGERARVLDHMACIPVMLGHAVPWDKVLVWIHEARRLAPNATTIHGTLGGALVQTGAYAEAIEVLTPLTTSGNDDTDRTVSSIFLAKAWDRQGDPAKAAQWLSKATELGDYDELRNRIAAELSPEARDERT